MTSHPAEWTAAFPGLGQPGIPAAPEVPFLTPLIPLTRFPAPAWLVAAGATLQVREGYGADRRR